MSANINSSQIIVPATRRHTATVIIFHGSGGTAEDMKQWFDTLNKQILQFPHIKLIYPTAPKQSYTPNGGMMQNVWFDRLAISNLIPEHITSIDSMCDMISILIKNEVAEGIPYDRIILGGFSMGGSLAMHLAYRYATIAGCFAMSSFLNEESVTYEYLKMNPEFTKVPLLQHHGTKDTLIPFEWGKETAKKLEKLGVNVNFVLLEDADHEITEEELHSWKKWLLDILPDN